LSLIALTKHTYFYALHDIVQIAICALVLRIVGPTETVSYK